MGERLYAIPEVVLQRLMAAEQELQCLKAAGVDNWQGMEEANDLMNDEDWSNLPEQEFGDREITNH